MGMDRRTFLKAGVCACGAAFLPAWLGPVPGAGAAPALSDREASHYEVLADGRIHCLLCPNGCVRAEGERSRCLVREPRGGKYRALAYGLPCVLAMDPVEKCPLFHYRLPGNAFSIATAGCNLGCQYCQNWQFSQKRPEETRNFALTPAEVIKKAKEYKASAISFFYTEPTIYFEYMVDIARAARQAGLPTVMVTGGYINPAPLAELTALIDAFVVGLKGFSEDYYRQTVDGSLAPVLAALQAVKRAGRHLEVVTLLVPTLNDRLPAIEAEAAWLMQNLGPDVPLHFTRFIPQFKLKGLPPTPIQVLEQARAIGRKAGLKFVYTGNVPAHEGSHTWCPVCGKAVIERLGFQVLRNDLVNGVCPHCQTAIPGRW